MTKAGTASGGLPTAGLVDFAPPWQPAPHLADFLGLRAGLTVVREDLLGGGGGGNKTRKLDVLCADALLKDAEVLVTAGAAQSNHVRLTAAAAARFGLRCIGILAGEPPSAYRGSLLLDRVLGLEIEWSAAATEAEINVEVAARSEELGQEGVRAYGIPAGGANALGCAGYATYFAGCRDRLGEADVVVASGSGGTQAGIAVGLGDHARVLGIQIGGKGPDELGNTVERLAAESARLLGVETPAGPSRVLPSYPDDGYGAPIEAVREVLFAAGRLEGLIFDPVYTARALAGLKSAVREGRVDRDRPIAFVHTGGSPALFSAAYDSWFGA